MKLVHSIEELVSRSKAPTRLKSTSWVYKGFNTEVNKKLVADVSNWLGKVEGATVVLGDFNEREDGEKFGSGAISQTNNTLMKKLNNEGFITLYVPGIM